MSLQDFKITLLLDFDFTARLLSLLGQHLVYNVEMNKVSKGKEERKEGSKEGRRQVACLSHSSGYETFRCGLALQKDLPIS